MIRLKELQGDLKMVPKRRWRRQIVVLAAALGVVLCGNGVAPDADMSKSAPEVVSNPLIATFSIVAADPDSGVCGAAVASRYPAVGKVVAHARAGVGAFCTQHFGVQKWGERALDLLENGKQPQDVLGELLKNDSNPDMRQLGIIDMKGRTALHHPTKAGLGSRYWGAMSGRFYACQGNTLTGRDVIVAMAKAYEETKGSVADRLMAALVAGDCAGGDHRGRLAAGIRVAKRDVKGYWLDLHVDKSADAVVDLYKQYVELKHDAKGDWPGGQPPFKHPCPGRVEPKPPGKV
jgi:uncharacterized Ntn-hydrolase superfamily protein